MGTFDNATKQVLAEKVGLQISGHLDSSTLKGYLSIAQYANWDLKKTSNTLTETLIGLFLMA